MKFKLNDVCVLKYDYLDLVAPNRVGVYPVGTIVLVDRDQSYPDWDVAVWVNSEECVYMNPRFLKRIGIL